MLVSASSNAGPDADFVALCRRADSLGLAVRGAFHPEPGEFEPLLPAMRIGTIILLGFTGSRQWARYLGSVEASDELPDPLDRWSRRVIGSMAAQWSATAIYPNGSSPRYPFSGSRPAARPCTEVRSVCSSIPNGVSGTPTAALSSYPNGSGCRASRRLPALAAPARRSRACRPVRCGRFVAVRSTSRRASITS